MPTPTWITKLQTRWKLNSVTQVIIVLIVFACTGFTVMLIKPYLHQLFFDEGSANWFHIAYWILILPFYNLLLLFYGFIFGQFRFFWDFEKRMFNRLRGKGHKAANKNQ